MNPDNRSAIVGRRFVSAGRTMFGRPLHTVLQVDSLELGPGRIPHARLINVRDRADRRLIAISALNDRSLYVEVDT